MSRTTDSVFYLQKRLQIKIIMGPQNAIGNAPRNLFAENNPRVSIKNITLLPYEGVLPRKYQTGLITQIIRVGSQRNNGNLQLIARVRTNNKKMQPVRIIRWA